MEILTPEQRRAVKQAGDSPVRLTDPETRRAYVLVSEDVYERLLPAKEDRVMENESSERIGSLAPTPNKARSVIGLMADEPELADEIAEEAMKARESRPFRIRNSD
jgi:hypothetical protein